MAETVDPDAARRDAQHILSDGRFRSSPTPRPLHGVLKWISDRFHGIGHAITSLFDVVPIWLLVPLLVALVAGIVYFVTQRLNARGAKRAATRQTAELPREVEESAAALEREADAAERAGDLERAVRLRFRAGLLRLGDRGAIRYRPSVTTTEVRRTLDSRRFDGLAGTFDEVTYGGRPAHHPDVETARREWPQVLEESSPR